MKLAKYVHRYGTTLPLSVRIVLLGWLRWSYSVSFKSRSLIFSTQQQAPRIPVLITVSPATRDTSRLNGLFFADSVGSVGYYKVSQSKRRVSLEESSSFKKVQRQVNYGKCSYTGPGCLFSLKHQLLKEISSH